MAMVWMGWHLEGLARRWVCLRVVWGRLGMPNPLCCWRMQGRCSCSCTPCWWVGNCTATSSASRAYSSFWSPRLLLYA